MEAAKEAADYANLEEASQALFRKQVQYIRAIVNGWSKAKKADQEAFVGGALPASSFVKNLKAVKVSQPANGKGSETGSASGSEAGSGSAPVSGAEVISGAEFAVRFASWLDGVDPAKLTATEAKAVAEAAKALDAFRAKVADKAKKPAKKAA